MVQPSAASSVASWTNCTSVSLTLTVLISTVALVVSLIFAAPLVITVLAGSATFFALMALVGSQCRGTAELTAEKAERVGRPRTVHYEDLESPPRSRSRSHHSRR